MHDATSQDSKGLGRLTSPFQLDLAQCGAGSIWHCSSQWAAFMEVSGNRTHTHHKSGSVRHSVGISSFHPHSMVEVFCIGTSSDRLLEIIVLKAHGITGGVAIPPEGIIRAREPVD
ncbi:hypothetical protein AVEN_111187-1 [Araneus ventricosus]|uniref:Uncharacterized protein n=1 Tax=Araneus ventricosus TaxID=182803 RepID=A0A4Y2T2N4_ARAVE|nr:hypothetical protein AVEN_111187-1 [Araneus ventricosus]